MLLGIYNNTTPRADPPRVTTLTPPPCRFKAPCGIWEQTFWGTGTQVREWGASVACSMEVSGTTTLSSCQAWMFLAVLGWGLGLPRATGLCMGHGHCGLWDRGPLPPWSARWPVPSSPEAYWLIPRCWLWWRGLACSEGAYGRQMGSQAGLGGRSVCLQEDTALCSGWRRGEGWVRHIY